MTGYRWLFAVWMFLACSSACQDGSTFFFKLDDESFRFDPPAGYCRAADDDLIYSQQRLAAFFPCGEYKAALISGDWNDITASIWLSVPEDPEWRNFNMTREQYIRESTTLLGTVTLGTERRTYYGDRRVPEDFKRPTPWIIPAESDEYGMYRPAPYFVQKEKGKIIHASSQVTAFTLIRGKAFEIRFSEEDPGKTKKDILMKRARINTKKFVMDNSDRKP
jgi:hypothetical protein